ncbi:MAG: sel1 repeat family protein, partial [Nitrospiraceae bacterium]
YAKARQWYEKAAAQGDAKAQLYLGMQYSFGQGGPVDLVQAYMWYSLAAGNGNAHAPGYRVDLTRQMTPAQIAEAQKRAREWKSKGK